MLAIDSEKRTRTPPQATGPEFVTHFAGKVDSDPKPPRIFGTMNRRPRPLAGLLALFALSLFLTEGVWTTVCPPDSGDTGTATVTEMAMGDAASASYATDATESGEDAGCPLGAIAMGGCVSAAVLSSAPAGIAIPDAPSGASMLVDIRPDLLFAPPLFRPPRA